MTTHDEQATAPTAPSGRGVPSAPPRAVRDDPAAAGRRPMESSSGDELRERIAATIDSMHHHPGELIPESWLVCPVCSGRGCPECDATGRMHPKRADWIEDAMWDAWDAFDRFAALVAHPRADPPGFGGAMLRLGRQMDALLREWAGEDPAVASVLAEVDAGRYGSSPPSEATTDS